MSLERTAAQQTDSNEITVEYLDEIVDAFNRQDVEAIAGYFAEDGEFRTARGPTVHGRRIVGPQAIAEYLSNRYKLIPDMRWVDGSHFISGMRALSEWTVMGTVTDGSRVEWRGCDIWEFNSERKITVKDTFWKTIED